MTAKIIDGREIARSIREELKTQVTELKTKHNIVPGLATLLVGDDQASHSYVGGKIKTCEALGIHSDHYQLPTETDEKELLDLIDKLNNEDSIHGILVQLPLPDHIDENKVLFSLNPEKDVDGFHPVSVGRLMIGEAEFLPCTPHGIQELLIRSGIKIEGADVVVVGRSNIVGKPVANILVQKQKGANATVTICHSCTKDIAAHIKRADILIAAIGKPKFITADMVKEGVVVIDVGTNEVGRTVDGRKILSGDVDFEAVKEKAAAITPVPGGVGPMTITMLMANTIKAARQTAGIN